MSMIADITTYLQTAGIGTIATNLFTGYMPDAGDTIVAVIDTGGPQPDKELPTKHPTFQVYVRAPSYETGKTKIEAIRSALHQVKNTTIGSTYFYYILAQSEGGHIGRNDRGLDEFSINFICLTQ